MKLSTFGMCYSAGGGRKARFGQISEERFYQATSISGTPPNRGATLIFQQHQAATPRFGLARVRSSARNKQWLGAAAPPSRRLASGRNRQLVGI